MAKSMWTPDHNTLLFLLDIPFGPRPMHTLLWDGVWSVSVWIKQCLDKEGLAQHSNSIPRPVEFLNSSNRTGFLPYVFLGRMSLCAAASTSPVTGPAEPHSRYSRVQWWSLTHLQPMLGIAHSDHRLVHSCSGLETHFMKLSS